MYQQTPQQRVTLKSIFKTLGLGVFSIATILYGGFALYPQSASAATLNTVNFQARLEGAGGSIAADGLYNIRFKLYTASSGGSSVWSEAYYDANGVTAGQDNRVQVTNGYVSVSLGSQTAFGALNWDQGMWVTMDVGGTAQTATPTYDGEMAPRLGLTGVPYAFTAGQLATGNGTLGSSLSILQPTVGNQVFQIADQAAAGTYQLCVQGSTSGCTASSGSGFYIQNQNASAQTTSNFWISGTGSADTALVSGGTISATGTPTASASASLLQLGSAIVAGSTAGNYIGVNAGSGFTGNLAELEKNNLSVFAFGANSTLTINKAAPTSGANDWTQSSTSGFGSTSNITANAFANYNGKLYTAMQNSTTGSQIYSTTDGTTWTQVNTSGFGSANNNEVTTMTVFNGALYAASKNSVSGSTVFRTTDGTTWTQVNTSGFGSALNTEIYALTAFSGKLYVGTSNTTTGTQIWSTSNGTTWTQANTSGFGSTNNQRVRNMAVYNGSLYAATYNSVVGMQVFSTTNGTTWAQSGANGLGAINNVAGYSMGTYNGALYIGTRGTTGGGAIYRTFDGATWSSVMTGGFGIGSTANDIYGLITYDGYLYSGTGNGTSRIFRSKDGSSWSQVNTNEFGLANNVNFKAMQTFNGGLYAGTNNPTNGGQVWVLDLGGVKATDGNLTVGGAQIGSIQIEGDNISGLESLTVGDVSASTIGASALQVAGDSTTVFQIQNAAGASFFTADSTKQVVTTKDLNIGTASSLGGAGRIFSDGFESGNYGLWAQQGSLVPETTIVRNGKYSAKVNASVNYSEARFTASGTVYMRAYVYVPGTPTGSPAIMGFADPTNAYYTGVYRNTGTNTLCVNWNNGANSGCSSTTLPSGQWVNLVLKQVSGTGSAGSLTLYMNGTQIYASGGINTTTTTAGLAFIGDGIASQTVYYDDISIDTVAPGDSSSLNVADSLHVSGSSTFGGGALFQSASNTTTAFQIQNAANAAVFSVDTAGAIATLGTASSLTGQLTFANASNGFTSTITGNTAATANYTTILPGAVGTSGYCLSLVSVAGTVQTLGYASCAGGGGGGANTQMSNLSGTVAINLGLVSAANNTLNLGSAANVWQNTYTGLLDAGTTTTTLGIGTVNATTVTVGGLNSTNLNLGNSANNKTVTIGATSTTAYTTAVNIGNTTSTGGASTVQIGGTGANNGSNTSTTVKLQAGQTALSLANAGLTLQSFSDSSTALQFQNAAGNAYFSADSANQLITTKDLYVGSPATLGGTARQFSDGFETNSFINWTYGAATTSGSSTAYLDTSMTHTGKVSFRAASSSGTAYLTTNFNSTLTPTVRAYVYVTSHTSANANLIKIAGGTGIFTIFRNISNGKLAFGNNTGSGNTDTSAVLTTGAWHEIEMDVNIDPTTGSANIYLDGALVLAQTGINTGSTPAVTLTVGETLGAGSPVATVNYDDIVVDTVRPGDSASLYISDNLRVAGITSFAGNVAAATNLQVGSTLTVGSLITTNSLATNSVQEKTYGSGIYIKGTDTVAYFDTLLGGLNVFAAPNSSGNPVNLVVTNGYNSTPFIVDTTIPRNLLINGDAESDVLFAPYGSGSVYTDSTPITVYNGTYSINLDTLGAGDGIQFTAFNTAINTGSYRFTFYAISTVGTVVSANYSVTMVDGTTHSTACTAGVTINTNGFQRVTCNVNVAGGNLTSLSLKQTDATARTVHLDAFQLESGTIVTPFTAGSVKLVGNVTSPVTVMGVSNSTTAFQIQNAVGSSNLLVADTLNNTLSLGGSALSSTLNLGATTSAVITSAVNIATNPNASAVNTVSIGNSAAVATTINIQGGTGVSAVAISAGSGGTIALGASNVANTINIGNAGAGGSVAQGINIGTNTSAGGTNTVVIGNTLATATTVTINGGTLANVALRLQTNGAGGITIDSGTTGSILIGNGSSAKIVTVGSTFSTSKLNLQGGVSTTSTGGVVISGGATQTNLVLSNGSTYAETATTCGNGGTVNNGALYYNTVSMALRACVATSATAGAWRDVVTGDGLGLLLFGIVDDSQNATTPGDLASVAGNGTGPCKVVMGSTTANISWTACTAYSGGRRVVVAAGTNVAVTVTSGWTHICLSGASGAVTGTNGAAETTSLSTVSYPSSTAPIVCLADISVNGTSITGIYDTRVFTSTTKQYVSINSTAGLGHMVVGTATAGATQLTTAATGNQAKIQGVVVATTGAASTSTVNAIIATAGPAWVKATGGTVNDYVQSSSAGNAGYAFTAATVSTGAYGTLGIARTGFTNTCTTGGTNNCSLSLLTILNIK